MKSIPAVFAAALLLGAMGCGGGSDPVPGGGSLKPVNGVCPPSSTSTCKQADLDTYSNCIIGKCDSAYRTCLGDGYKTGTFGGACGTYVACTQKCNCGDTACTTACGQPPAECTSCLTGTLAACVTGSGCSTPACYTTTSLPDGGLPGGGGTCADLMRCCASMTGQMKTACDMQYNAVKAGGDSACGAAFGVYKAAMICK
jgi:hypothetical protein